MDAKSRANFINSVADGKNIPCKSCNKLNSASSRFCIFCGKPLIKPQMQEEAKNVFAEEMQEETQKNVFAEETQEETQKNVFAEGLPDWDLIPPQVVVRRRKK